MARRKLKFERNRTQLQIFLDSEGITVRQLEEITGVALATVSRSLNIAGFHKVDYGDVLKIRLAIQDLRPDMDTAMFAEYDRHVYLPKPDTVELKAVSAQ